MTATASDPTGDYSEFSPCIKAAHANVPQVLAQDFAFTPLTVKVSRGGTVQWNFAGPSPHTVTDATGMALYDSGVKTAGQTYTGKFNAAGGFPYTSTGEAMVGKVTVPVKVSAASPSSYTVTWAAAPPPAGLAEYIQVKRPGSTSFTNWLTSQTGTSATFSPDAGAGTYSFHARERKSADGTASAWSPIATIKVS
jgi:plastocyanin